MYTKPDGKTAGITSAPAESTNHTILLESFWEDYLRTCGEHATIRGGLLAR